MARVKIKDKEYDMANISRLVHYSLHETLLFLGTPKADNKTLCFGIGLVKVIQKGKDFDLVGMDFGRGYTREIFVKNNHARRQIYTLKKGQYAWFYGMISCYTDKDDKKKTTLYAKAFQGWFVPKNMDIIKVDPNEVERLSEENQSKLNFIDELFREE